MVNMKRMIAVALVLLASATVAEAAKLKATPVQDAFAASLALGAWQDKTGNGNNSRTWSETSSRVDSHHDTPDRKSIFKAGLLSALIPGGGEYYLGHRKKARYFFAAEALTWVGFISFRTYGNWKEDDFIRYAATHANAQLKDKDDEFRDLVGFYDDIDQYNSAGRIFDPDRPYLEDIPANHWRWKAEEDKDSYRELKNRSREAFRRADFMLGAALVNRVISIVDAVRDARRALRRLENPFSRNSNKKLKLVINPFRANYQIRLTLFTDF